MKKVALANVLEVVASVVLQDFDGFLSHIAVFHPFESIFVYGVREWSSFILLHVAVQFSQHHLLKRLSFFHWMLFSLFVKD